ncbi:hypothetical protein GJ496_011379 [Pomphorhynchus laevis]|nr:hypothetical protein GJ496_011379 [Pomphorhynchus laevis]
MELNDHCSNADESSICLNEEVNNLSQSISMTDDSISASNTKVELNPLNTVSADDVETVSKSQLKKRMKIAKLRERRKLKKKSEKERVKRTGENKKRRGSRKVIMMSDSTCKQRIAIDLQFQNKMSDKDQMQLSRQLMFSYAANRRSPCPMQLFITSNTGNLKERLLKINSTNWDVNISAKHISELFKKEDIVYLTSESDNELLDLDGSKVYIVGGLVDHNSLKSFCFNYAVEKGFSHARLPIDRFVTMKTRRVLTVNHVMQIMINYVASNDWKTAFESAIPARTGFTSKDSTVKINLSNDCAEQHKIQCIQLPNTDDDIIDFTERQTQFDNQTNN